jgi:hypothetical protein
MEDIIRQALLHIETIGPQVVEGHFDLIGPNGDIILPQVWEMMVEPGWDVTMRMWSVSELPGQIVPLPAPAPDKPALKSRGNQMLPLKASMSEYSSKVTRYARPQERCLKGYDIP